MKKKFLAGACLAAFMSVPAVAEEDSAASTKKTPLYLEAGPTVLLTELEGEIDDLLLEDNISLNALTVRGGVQLSDYLSLEADLAFGTSGENLNEGISLYSVDGKFSGEVSLNYLAGIYLKGDIPLSKDGSVKALARVGYVTSELEASGTVSAVLDEPPVIDLFDTSFTVPGSYSMKGTFTAERSGPVGGGGVEFGFSEHLYLRGEATYYGLENAPTVAVTATLGYRF